MGKVHLPSELFLLIGLLDGGGISPEGECCDGKRNGSANEMDLIDLTGQKPSSVSPPYEFTEMQWASGSRNWYY